METKRFKPKFNIKKGDSVVVISGEDKNLTTPRKVLAIFIDESRVLLEGVNMVKRHTKPTAQNTGGGIISKEAPIHISNVMLWDAKAKKGVKVKRVREDNKIKRVSKKTGEIL